MQFESLNVIFILLGIFLFTAWMPSILRAWRAWRHLKQYPMPFLIAALISVVIMFEYQVIRQVISNMTFPNPSLNYYSQLVISIMIMAAVVYFLIGSLIAYRRDIVYNRFIDALVREKFKAKEVSRKALFLGRYPEDILEAVATHPRVPCFSTRTLLGYILTGFAAFPLITWFSDYNVMFSTIFPTAPQLSSVLTLSLIVTLFTAGLLILAEKWPYAGLAVIALTTLLVALTIHIPYLLLTQAFSLTMGILAGIITLSKEPEKYDEPIETPPKLAALVTIKPSLPRKDLTAIAGGVTILIGGILTHIWAILASFFYHFMIIPAFSFWVGTPLMNNLLYSLFLYVAAGIAGFLSIIAGILVLAKRWRSGALLGLVCGILSLLVLCGIITIIGAIIVLASYPRPDKTQETTS